jgi:hypothetical protein
MELGEKIQILLMEDEYYGRVGIVVEISRRLIKVQFGDGAFRYYNKLEGIDLQKV